MSTDPSTHPSTVSIPQSALEDLQTRLRLARWPDKEVVSDLTQGVPLATIQELCEYWQAEYDWRRCEALLNSYPQFTTNIDGVEIYFIHVSSKHEGALPMLLTHGWPGSVLEFKHVIDRERWTLCGLGETRNVCSGGTRVGRQDQVDDWPSGMLWTCVVGTT